MSLAQLVVTRSNRDTQFEEMMTDEGKGSRVAPRIGKRSVGRPTAIKTDDIVNVTGSRQIQAAQSRTL